MGLGKKYQPEQAVNLLRQIEVSVANGKTTAQASKEARIVVVLSHAGLEQMEQDLGVLRIVLVPGVMHGFAGSLHSKRSDQLQMETLGLQKVRQRPVVVPVASKTTRTGCLRP